MRGLLRIRSTLAPFRRAGLSFASVAEPVEVDIRDLDGPRLMALVRDPALSMQIADGSGAFVRVIYRETPLAFEMLDCEISSAEPAARLTGEFCQRAIDHIGKDMPPPTPEQAAEPEGGDADLAERNQRQAELVESLNAKLARAHEDIAALTQERDATQASLTAANALIADHSATLDAITAELAARNHPALADLLASYDRVADALATAQAAAEAAGRLKEETLGEMIARLAAAASGGSEGGGSGRGAEPSPEPAARKPKGAPKK